MSSLHMDVRFLACPELLYLATSAGYEVQNKKILRSSNSKELERITRHCPWSQRQAEYYPYDYHHGARDQ